MAVRVWRRWAVDETIAEEGYPCRWGQESAGTSEGRKDFCRRKGYIMCIRKRQHFKFMTSDLNYGRGMAFKGGPSPTTSKCHSPKP